MEVLVFGGVIVFVAGIIYLAYALEKKRTEAVIGFAQTHGFEVDPNPPGIQAQMSAFKLFTTGRSRRARNLIRTARGDDRLAICDYQYTTGSGKNSTTHQQTVCIVQASRLKVPHFYARRQIAFFDFLGKVFGGQDINFDSDPAFSKSYVLQTQEPEEQIRGLFDERVRMTFTQLAPKNVQVEAKGDTLVFHYGKRVKIEQMLELVEDALTIRQLFR